MKSPLDGRDFFKGDLRSRDFNIWTKPKEVLEVPFSIFDAGTIKENEAKKAGINSKKLHNSLFFNKHRDIYI